MSRRTFLLGIGIAVVALAFAVTDWVVGPAPGVTEANARRIKPGMTLREVEAILGARGLCVWDGTSSTIFRPHPYLWAGPDARVIVEFTNGGTAEEAWREQRVVRNGVTFQRSAPSNLLARLRSWLGW
jgi:hypothetical protein